MDLSTVILMPTKKMKILVIIRKIKVIAIFVKISATKIQIVAELNVVENFGTVAGGHLVNASQAHKNIWMTIYIQHVQNFNMVSEMFNVYLLI